MRLENAMKVSLYEGMQAMRQLVTDVRIHLWSGNSAISRFQFNGQSLYLLTQASGVVKNDSLSNDEKVKKIWNGITESLTQDEDTKKATESLENFLRNWRRTCKLKLPERDKQMIENQIRRDFERGLKQQHSDIEDLFNQLREYFEGLRSKLEETQKAVELAEKQRTIIGVFLPTVKGGVTDVVGGIASTLFSQYALPIMGAALLIVGACEGIKLAQNVVENKGGGRFLNRKDPKWYPSIENSLFDYIRGNMTDDELMNLISDEQLEEDLHHIKEHLQGWILPQLTE